MRWQVKRARYPIDPNRAWLAIPSGSIIHARRFATWAEAWAYASTRRS